MNQNWFNYFFKTVQIHKAQENPLVSLTSHLLNSYLLALSLPKFTSPPQLVSTLDHLAPRLLSTLDPLRLIASRR